MAVLDNALQAFRLIELKSIGYGIRVDLQTPGHHSMLNPLAGHHHNEKSVFKPRRDIGVIKNFRNIV